MLEHIDLDRRVGKKEFKEAEDEWEIRLGQLQRAARDAGIPVIIVFEGWDAAGKGTLINNLILPLDPRGLKVHSTLEPTEEEALRPFLWRPWIRTPQHGRIAIFDRSWYRQLLTERVEGGLRGDRLRRSVEDICAFERQLADDGAVIVKLFLHISKKEQKKRFEKLRKHKTTAWRVTESDLRRHKKYDEYLEAANEMLTDTDAEHAPWTIVEARDERFATLKIFNTVALALQRRLAEQDDKPASDAAPPAAQKAAMPEQLRSNILEGVDLDQTLEKDEYKDRLKAAQKELRKLEHRIYMERQGVVIVYEGWDAAGKGGNIRRLVRQLDPRGYEVVPIAAPNDIEKAHHYLWRFWTQMPKAGHITLFDRSWYGRVLVERVEGFCSEHQWRRAYREINEMERHVTNFGHLVLKFWLHVSPEEQLRRFEARQQTEHKQWKITDEDWRNRKRWDQYEAAVEEMLFRTSTPDAPWTIIESDCKRFARVKTIETVCDAIKTALKQS
jgi:polyphosphate:AMP phosphotransferase